MLINHFELVMFVFGYLKEHGEELQWRSRKLHRGIDDTSLEI